MCAKLFQSCPTLCNPMTVAYQAALSVEFSRQGCWSGVAISFSRDPPDPGINPMSLMSSALAGRFFTTIATWEAKIW